MATDHRGHCWRAGESSACVARMDTEAISLESDPEKLAAFHELLAEILAQGRAVALGARGNSMGPLIPPGAVVTIGGCRAEDLRVGDVVLVRPATSRLGKFLLHRLVAIERCGAAARYCTQGDAGAPDPDLVGVADCLGRLVAVRDARGEIDLRRRVWRWLNPCLAALARLQGRRPGALRRAARLAIALGVALGARLSRSKFPA